MHLDTLVTTDTEKGEKGNFLIVSMGPIKLLQSAKMMSTVLLFLFIVSFAVVSGTIQFPQLPSQWQDSWHLGLQDDTLTIQANSIAANFRTIDISQFLDETSIISAHMQNRCNICHVVKELHPNVLSMQVSDCLSQVKTNFIFKPK